tara:strand:+ start:117 stop:1007 length:891 start_codon:yes stop_codon:yes gene_type:complete
MKTDPRHLIQLSMIVEAGSFQGAADRLGMTQPALSRNIRLLESRIGTPLFDRSARKAVPTEAGLKLAQHGLTIRIAEDQASAFGAMASRGAVGALRVGAPPIIAGHFLTNRISRFVHDNPLCQVELRVGLVHELRTMLERGQIDIVIGPRGLAEHLAELSFEPLIDDRIGILCRVGHPLETSRAPGPRVLENHRWVAHSRGSTLRLQTETALAAMGIDHVQIGVETDSIRSVLEIVAATDLLSTMPRETTRPYLSSRLKFLDIDHPQFSRPIGIVRRKSLPKKSIAENFIGLLRAR